jgi:uncharacterized membrane protein
MTGQPAPEPSAVTARRLAFERRIGRLLIVVTYLAVALLVVGVGLMIAAGISPLAGGPALDIESLMADLLGFAPAGFLWLGLLVVIATPISRVIAAAIGFGRAGDRLLVLIACAILLTIAISVASALATT